MKFNFFGLIKKSNLWFFFKNPRKKINVHTMRMRPILSFCPRWKTPQYFSSDNFLLCVFQYWRFSLFFPLQESWVISITKVLPCRCPLQWLHWEATTKSEDLNKKTFFVVVITISNDAFYSLISGLWYIFRSCWTTFEFPDKITLFDNIWKMKAFYSSLSHYWLLIYCYKTKNAFLV